jgi:predicted small lipoprotein YifL
LIHRSLAPRGGLDRRAGRLLVLLLVVVSLAGCGVAAPQGSLALPPRTTPTPEPTVTTAVAQTRLQIAGALAAAGFQLSVPTVPFRPPESPRLAAAPRAVFQVVLPNDPTHGYIVVYEFPDAATANIAGSEMADYLGGGPGKVQFTPDTMHVLRQLGTTLIFYSWSPANSPGPDTATIGMVLTSVGQGFDIPR